MEIKCPYCGQCYEIAEQNIGQIAQCERCNRKFQIAIDDSPVILSKSKSGFKFAVAALFAVVLLAGLAIGTFFYYRKTKHDQEMANAAMEVQRLAMEKKLLEEKEKARLAAEKRAQQEAEKAEKLRIEAKKREMEEAARRREEAKRVEEIKKAEIAKQQELAKREREKKWKQLAAQKEENYRKLLREKNLLISRYVETLRNSAADVATPPDGIDEELVQKIKVICDEEKRTQHYFPKILDGTIPPNKMMECVEAFPDHLQARVAQIIICQCILKNKSYPRALLSKTPGFDFQNDPLVYTVCSSCKGSGKLHCITCKDTRVCQRCHGSGQQKTKVLRNNEYETRLIPCSEVCQLCAGVSCRKCGGTKKEVSPELPRKITKLCVEVRDALRDVYRVQIEFLAKKSIASADLHFDGDLPPENSFYHGSFSTDELGFLTPDELASTRRKNAHYSSLKTALQYKKERLPELKNLQKDWKSSIQYGQNSSHRRKIVTVSGVIQDRTNNGWYLFTSGDEIGVLKLADGKEYTSRGAFTCECFANGMQKFSKKDGSVVEIPSFIAVSEENKQFVKLTAKRIEIAEENLDLCLQFERRLASEISKIEKLLAQMEPPQNPIIEITTDQAKYLVDNNQSVDLCLLIQQGLDVNRVYTDGSEKITLLTYAAKKGRKEMVDLLLATHADIDLCGEIMCPELRVVSALGLAAATDNLELLELLLKRGATVHNGFSPYRLSWENRQRGGADEFDCKVWESLNRNGGSVHYASDPLAGEQWVEIYVREAGNELFLRNTNPNLSDADFDYAIQKLRTRVIEDGIDKLKAAVFTIWAKNNRQPITQYSYNKFDKEYGRKIVSYTSAVQAITKFGYSEEYASAWIDQSRNSEARNFATNVEVQRRIDATKQKIVALAQKTPGVDLKKIRTYDDLLLAGQGNWASEIADITSEVYAATGLNGEEMVALISW